MVGVKGVQRECVGVYEVPGNACGWWEFRRCRGSACGWWELRGCSESAWEFTRCQGVRADGGSLGGERECVLMMGVLHVP